MALVPTKAGGGMVSPQDSEILPSSLRLPVILMPSTFLYLPTPLIEWTLKALIL